MSGADEYHGLPTPRTTLRAGYLDVLVWRQGGCRRQAPVDLQALIVCAFLCATIPDPEEMVSMRRAIRPQEHV